jgi:hypothetical protein
VCPVHEAGCQLNSLIRQAVKLVAIVYYAHFVYTLPGNAVAPILLVLCCNLLTTDPAGGRPHPLQLDALHWIWWCSTCLSVRHAAPYSG